MHAFSNFGVGPQADFGDIPTQAIGVKLGPSLVKMMDVWCSAAQALGRVSGVVCAYLMTFFCGLCLILSSSLQLNNRSSHTSWGWEGSGNIGGFPLLV